MRFRLSKGKIDMLYERFVIREMMVDRKESDKPLRVQLQDAHQAIGDGRPGPLIVRLDEQARRRNSRNLMAVITLVRPRHDQERLWSRYRLTYAALGLLQECFAPTQSAELLWPVVACDATGQGKEPLAIPTR